MNECVFCKVDETKIFNTIIEKTKNFYIKPTKGSLVAGYLMIISKRHIFSMLELNQEEKEEYLFIIEKYRNLFFRKYNKYPIIFEHSSSLKEGSASSIKHAHTHIVNHNFTNEKNVLQSLNFQKIDNKLDIEKKDKTYIFYISPEGKFYITYDFEKISQMMRILIAKDLGIEDKYNWREYSFTENIIKTIEDFK